MRYAATNRRRAGFSLLEILVATSMLAVATAALSQLAAVGRSHLSAATEKSIAAHLVRNQLVRLASGVDPLTEVTGQPLAEDPRWEVKIEILPIAVAPGLIEVEVSVRPLSAAGADAGGEQPRWYSVAQWMRGAVE